MKAVLLFFVLTICQASYSQCLTGVWTWLRGDSMLTKKDLLGNEGILNVPDGKNDPSGRVPTPGILINKEIWFYGGSGVGINSAKNVFSSVFLNDIWKYDPASGIWTRVWGSNTIAPSNIPVYGTQGQFAASTNPGGRAFPSVSVDANNNIWLAGGLREVALTEVPYSGGQSGTNELWMFNTSKKQWSWIWGSTSAIEKGSYVNKGSFSVNAKPCNRLQAFSWFDKSGILWLYGGVATNDVLPAVVPLNDIWKFDPTTYQWCWVGGDAPDFSVTSTPAVPNISYGTAHVESSSNTPGARQSHSSAFYIVDGNLWLFGGREGEYSYMKNDLWLFNTKKEKWVWKGGGSGYNTYSIFGTQGKFDPLNVPSARTGSTMFGFHGSRMFFYGGVGLTRKGESTNANGTFGTLSDLWSYDTTSRSWAWIAGDSVGIRPPVYGSLKVPDSKNNPGARDGAFGMVQADSLILIAGHLRNKETTPSINNSTNDVWRYTLRPVSTSLSALKVEQIGDDNIISWTAVTASGSPVFTIQKSTDNQVFLPLAAIGSLTGVQNYSYSHINAWKNDSSLYYRILIDGGPVCSSYSDTFKIKKHSDDIWISPNPGSGTIKVNIASAQKDTATIRLISIPGVILQTKHVAIQPGINAISFDVRFYASATYFMEVRLRQKRKTLKFIKHN